MNRQLFFHRLSEVKTENLLMPSTTITTDKERRRIAILVNDEFLKAGGSVQQGMLLERELYDELAKERLSCDEIEYERRSKELGHKDFNPLRLHFSERYHDKCTNFVDRIISILKQEDSNGRNNRCKRTIETQRLDKRGRAGKILRHRKADNRKLET